MQQLYKLGAMGLKQIGALLRSEFQGSHLLFGDLFLLGDEENNIRSQDGIFREKIVMYNSKAWSGNRIEHLKGTTVGGEVYTEPDLRGSCTD